MIPTYALLALPRPRRLKLVSRYEDSGRAFIAYRLADPPCLSVRLDDGLFGFTVQAAKERDLAFRAAVREAVGTQGQSSVWN